MKTWLVVADAAHCRVLETIGIGKQFVGVTGSEMEQDLPRSHDIGTERPSRTHESKGMTRHAIEPRVDPHRELKRTFAVGVAQYLDEAAAAGAFDRLVIAAPPAMLGDIRHALGAHAAARIVAEVPKDLVKIADQHLRDHLQDVIAI